MSERAEQLQTAVAQSVSVQEGLKGLLSWLDQLVLNPGPVEPTAQAVQEALTQNQVRVNPGETAGFLYKVQVKNVAGGFCVCKDEIIKRMN